jgi:tRNA(Ile)-lysidine synthase
MPPSLELRFQQNIRRLGLADPGGRLLVAVSGGRDSMVLLYLLRHCSPARELIVAHLDHAMRPESASDARWLRGVCSAWELPLVTTRLEVAPRGETQARAERYAFLRRAAREHGAEALVTAHHADDQAETVLFRALRGTGLGGLAGIREVSAGGLVRPLLPFWRSELQEFAERNHIRWREDATNQASGAARNRIRHRLLPLAEELVAPGARANLVRLSRLAADADSALERQARRAELAIVREESGAVLLARSGLREYDEAVGSRVLRNALRRFGMVPGGTGTRRALQFIMRSPSGRVLELPGGVRLSIEFDLARITRDDPPTPDQPLVFNAPGPAEELEQTAWVGGRQFGFRARVGRAGDAHRGGETGVAVPLAAIRFPCALRGWQPGDKLRTPGGTKSLKKLFVERRIPRSERHRLPVLADSAGRVLWVAGVGLASDAAPDPGEAALLFQVGDA